MPSRGSVTYEVEHALRTIFKRCVQCPPTQPTCPSCKSTEICSLVPEDCNSCASTACIIDPTGGLAHRHPHVGAIAGGVLAGVAAAAIVVFFVWFCWIRKQRQQQEQEWEAEVEEWEHDDVAQQKTHSVTAIREDAASTRTRGSLANSLISRASNIIQIAYIPGVTNRNRGPVPPLPAARRQSVEAAPRSPLSNPGDQLFFRPGDLRDSSLSATLSMASRRNRDTQYTHHSITPSLARSSMASELYSDNAAEMPMPVQAVARVAPRIVSVKSVSSASLYSGHNSGSQETITPGNSQGKSAQIMDPRKSQDSVSLFSAASVTGKVKQVVIGGKGRFPVQQASDASTALSAMSKKHAPSIPSPLAEVGFEELDADEDEHARARRSLVSTPLPLAEPTESPFFDASEQPWASSSGASFRRNPYAAMSSSVGVSGSRPMGSLSAVIEEATKRASRVPGHEAASGKEEASPFDDVHATTK